MSDREGWSCWVCGGLYSTKAYRDEHFMRSHPDRVRKHQFANPQFTRHRCTICDGAFNQAMELFNHMRDHHGRGGPSIVPTKFAYTPDLFGRD
ncbi:MAG TPA: hypothetical protein VGH38_28770 [Bryobacteraceae bacterium]